MVGKTLAHYEVLEPLGAGGMGEVYRARDTKLDRDVAIKVLPEDFAADRDRLARFEREAKLLASLNHANIAAIYGLESSDGVRFIAMELVEGETLAHRLAVEGRIEVEEALKIARQISEALEAAHKRGIIHRDLKPANIKFTPDGKVKVLDFGLAKAYEADGPVSEISPDLSRSPTLIAATTRTGMIMGTAAYMSPEQARGKPLDRRTDIFSFGCVLYEMLTGHQPFVGGDVADTLAAILKEEPDWSRLAATPPPLMQFVLQRCLTKDPDRRLHDIADARIAIEEVLSDPRARVSGASAWADQRSGPSLKAIPAWRRGLPWGLAVLAAAVTGTVVWASMRPAPPPVAKFSVSTNPPIVMAGRPERPLTVSPDGSRLVYTALVQGQQQLYLREMDEFEALPIPGTEGARGPFFSPDGRWVGFQSGYKLMKVALAGGAPVPICDVPVDVVGASWGGGDDIVFALLTGELERVSADGGTPQVLTDPDRDKGERRHFWPHILPDGAAVLFTVAGTDRPDDEDRIAVLSVKTGEWDVVLDGSDARYVPTGHLLYAREGSMLAVPFDPERLVVEGPPVSILESVGMGGSGQAYFAVSATGLLAYVPGDASGGGDALELAWVARDGKPAPLAEDARGFRFPRISPEGERLALTRLTTGPNGSAGVWIHDMEQGTSSLLTFEGVNVWPVWSPDGQRVAFSSTRRGPFNPYWKLADGSGEAEHLLASENPSFPSSWSPDGKLLAFVEVHPSNGGDIWVLPLESDRSPSIFLDTPDNERAPVFSPDGRWIAYVSDQSGQEEVYVRPYPPDRGGVWRISSEGGIEPAWASDGTELYYRSGDRMMAVAVETEPTFVPGRQQALFEGPYAFGTSGVREYDVSPDGKRFLMVREEAGASIEVRVVLNWFEELRQLLPTGR